MTGSFTLHLHAAAKRGFIPEKVIPDIAEQAPNFAKWSQAVMAHPSVNGIFDEEYWAAKMKARIAKLKGEA